jgi:methyltransferase (TIGR00027 family)
LDTTAFSLPAWASDWRVFEVDQPATQEWKRRRIDDLGWAVPSNLVFAPCDFERQSLLDALDAAGLDREAPVQVSLFGVTVYLTLDATRSLFSALAKLAPGSEVALTYCPPPDGSDPVADETFERAAPVVDSTGESFVGYHRAPEIEKLLREAGFADIAHYSVDDMNAHYFTGRSDDLRLYSIEQLVVASCSSQVAISEQTP